MHHLMGSSGRDARSLRPPGEDEIAGQARKDTEDEPIEWGSGGSRKARRMGKRRFC